MSRKGRKSRRTRRTRRPKAPTAPTARRRGLQRWEIAVIVVAAVAAAWAGWSSWRGDRAEDRFLELAAGGAASLSNIQTIPDAGGGHLELGQSVSYGTRFPTSGVHDRVWVNPGVYDETRPPTGLVHSLEHGMVVIYYDRPDAAVMETLRSWAALYAGPWSGIVVAPAPGIGDMIMMTSWNRTLRLQPFEPAVAAAFVDRYRGRGPEQPVR